MAQTSTCPGCGAPVKPDWTVCEKCLLPRNIVSGQAEATVTIRCQCGGRMGPLDSICPSCRRPKPRIETGRPDTDQTSTPKTGSLRSIGGSFAFGLAALVLGAFIYSKQKAVQTPEPEKAPAATVSTRTAAPIEAADVVLPALPADWTIKGRVYDLLTLKPVADCQLILKDKLSGKKFSAKTDAAGAYSLEVKPLDEGGYEVAVLLQGRARPFLEEMEPPYREQERDRRAEALEMMSSPSLVHVPIMLPSGQFELAYDLVLASSGRH